MTYFKADDRKPNAVLFLGVTCLGLTYFTLTSSSNDTRIVWTTFLMVLGWLLIGLALLIRYKVSLSDHELILKNRLGCFTKRIRISDIRKVKVLDQEYPITLYRNTLLHLVLWNKKFSRFRQIHIFNIYGAKLFTIDGQCIDDSDFNRLVKVLKSKVASNNQGAHH